MKAAKNHQTYIWKQILYSLYVYLPTICIVHFIEIRFVNSILVQVIPSFT